MESKCKIISLSLLCFLGINVAEIDGSYQSFLRKNKRKANDDSIVIDAKARRERGNFLLESNLVPNRVKDNYRRREKPKSKSLSSLARQTRKDIYQPRKTFFNGNKKQNPSQRFEGNTFQKKSQDLIPRSPNRKWTSSFEPFIHRNRGDDFVMENNQSDFQDRKKPTNRSRSQQKTDFYETKLQVNRLNTEIQDLKKQIISLFQKLSDSIAEATKKVHETVAGKNKK